MTNISTVVCPILTCLPINTTNANTNTIVIFMNNSNNNKSEEDKTNEKRHFKYEV